MASPRFEDVSVGLELEPKAYRVSRGDLVNYAGVSGDRNPIHWHEKVANAAGFDDVLAHGMLTMAYGAEYITGWVGDPSAVRGYEVRFVSPLLVPADTSTTLEFAGRVKSLDPETKTGVVALTAIANEKKIFGKAVATVQFA
ncbi:MAG: MaoC/PaaZ C-terminal domain-containing protein [Segniliparus sp.]|uniref:MaoC/PaaZ C-terminal domain-containing protein n=1 Tax=Segniliparus sp. TaxID=2804064 RepID=UPI003F3270A6